MSHGRMEFEFKFSKPKRAAGQPDDDDPFRILVVGDFSGHRAVPLAQRKPLSIDIDSFDTVFARLAPRAEIDLDGSPLTLGFGSPDDFHPDALYRRLAPFEAMRQLRSDLNDPKLYQRALQSLGASAPAPAAAAPAASPSEDEAEVMERLLGRKPSSPVSAARPAPAAGFDLDGWLKSAMAPFVVPEMAQEQKQLIVALEAALAEQMRRVLHHPTFQALEARWLGLSRLVRNLETDGTLKIHLLDLSREEMEADIEAHADDLSQTALFQVLQGPASGAPDGRRWSLLVGDYHFGAGVQDVRLLSVLGAMAAQAGAPLLAGARPEVLGSAGGGSLAEPKGWLEAEAPELAYWNALRRSAVAPWIGLALPRVLARLPYGKATDRIESFPFEEMPPSRPHEAYLWGNPAFELAVLAGQAFQEEGWGLELDGHNDIDDLPSHIYKEDGETLQQPGAELLLSEPIGTAMLARGPMALLSYRNRNAARLLRWQSIAEPAQALQGAWTMADA